jgi:hypothetical protein
MDHVDKSFRKLEGGCDEPIIAYHKFCAADGVRSLAVNSNQAEFLDGLSLDARLFYLAFAHVDGTDGIANGVARNILDYVGAWEVNDE